MARHIGSRSHGDAVTHAEFGFYMPRRYWASRLAPYAGEWAATAALWPMAEGAHLWLDTGPTAPWASAGLSLLGCGMSALTWCVGRARGAMTRRMATATVAVGSAWFTAATIAGPTTQPMLGLWAVGGVATALAWNIKRALRSGGGDEDSANGLFEKLKLAKVRSGPAEVTANRVTVPLALRSSETTVEDVQKAAPRIDQELGLPRGATRVVGDPDNAAAATMTIVPTDVLRDPQVWPGPSSSGGSIADPLVVGLYEDGTPVRLWLPGDKSKPRVSTHVQLNGGTGAGKTHGGRITWTEILTRRDAVLVVLDPVKGAQSTGFLPDGSAYVVTGLDACRAFLRRVPAAVATLADQLGRWGFDQWTPDAFTQQEMPYLVLWVEEASKVLEDASTITDIVETARSAGVTVVLSQQKSSYRRMSTDIRSQLGTGWCYGVKELDDATYCLSDELIQAGARPDRWQNRRPGCFYLETPGVELDQAVMPGRTFSTTDRAMIDQIVAHAAIRPALHPIQARTLGLPTRPGAAAPTANQEDTNDNSEEMTAVVADHHAHAGPLDAAMFADAESMDGLPDDADGVPFPLPADPEPDLPGDATTNLPELDADVADSGLPQPRPSRSEARARLVAILTRWAMGGRTRVTVRDFPEENLYPTFGRGRSWLSTELSKLVESGLLTPAGNEGNATVYTLRPPASSTQGRYAA